MKQVFHPYQVWEGYLNGMYEPCKEGREKRVKVARWLLANPISLRESMQRVTKEWTHETEHVLSDPAISHRAWLGQSACNIYCGAREDETREAWGLLTDQERRAANQQADEVDRQWRELVDGTKRPQLSLFDAR